MVASRPTAKFSEFPKQIQAISDKKMEEIPKKKVAFQKIIVPKIKESRKIVELKREVKKKTETQQASQEKLKEVMEKIKRKISEEKEAAEAKKARVMEKPHQSGSINSLRQAVEKGQRKVSQRAPFLRLWK